MIDAISQTGGIIGVLAGLGVIINSLFASTILKLNMMKKLYKKSSQEADKISEKLSNKKGKNEDLKQKS